MTQTVFGVPGIEEGGPITSRCHRSSLSPSRPVWANVQSERERGAGSRTGAFVLGSGCGKAVGI